MIHVYYHIYATDGVDSIIDEQLHLIKTHFDFPYKLSVGISLSEDDKSIYHLFQKFDNIRDVRARGNEFVTLDLIEKDKDKFDNSDYILYLHTKGASKQSNKNVTHWRQMMNYFNIEKVKNVFKIFEKTDFNTYGCLLTDMVRLHYSGNFWWMKGSYAKTIQITKDKGNRFNAETDYIQNGIDWKPYSPYNSEVRNNYQILFERKEYAK